MDDKIKEMVIEITELAEYFEDRLDLVFCAMTEPERKRLESLGIHGESPEEQDKNKWHIYKCRYAVMFNQPIKEKEN